MKQLTIHKILYTKPMNHFQALRTQIRAYLIFVILIENLLIIVGLSVLIWLTRVLVMSKPVAKDPQMEAE